MGGITLDMRIDIKEATKYLKDYERKVITRATNRAINTTARNVHTEIKRYISKITGLKVGFVGKGISVHKSSFGTLRAEIVGRGRAVNLIRFVSAGKRAVGAFSKQLGVRANAWRTMKTYHGAFIIRGRGHGRLIVVARTDKTRYPIRGLPGPSVRIEMHRPPARRLMVTTAIERFKINFERDLRYYIQRVNP